MRQREGRDGCGVWTLMLAVLWLTLPVACTGPGTRSGADAVRLAGADQLRDCTNVGTVHVSVIDKLPELEKVEGAVAGELAGLARNSALQLGGNALAALTDVIDGSQSFAVFRCP